MFLFSQASYNNIEYWIKDLKSNSSPDIKIFLIGNKVDLETERVISADKAINLTKNYDLELFMETSAKTGFNADVIFVKAAFLLYNEFVLKRNKSSGRRKNSSGSKLEDSSQVIKEHKNKCC